MASALYDPAFGYYSRRIRQVGRRGDFSTSATLSPALGEAIARWAESERVHLGLTSRWDLIEVGAGSGEMAGAILQSLGWWKRRQVRYHIVEVSEPLQVAQQKRLQNRALWHPAISAALQACQGRAIIFSNELVDAFPCRLIEKTADGWSEIGVTSDGASFREQPRPIDASEIPASLQGQPFAPGQRAEIHRTYHQWLAECARELACGTLLTLDYGGAPAEIYHRRPGGTLRGYVHQMRFEGAEIYERVGQQDLTADVNFADLIAVGRELGFENVSLTTQREFLQAHLPRFQTRAASDPALAFLADPVGAGTGFKALLQRKSA